MNILLFTSADRLDDDTVAVTDRRLRHLIEVHRASVGDQLRVGEVDGLLGTGELLALGDDGAVLRVTLEREPPPKLPLQLVLALPRPKMLRRILRSVAEFGVAELHLIHSFRVEKSYWQTPVLQPASLRGYLLQGLEQAGDTRLPTVHSHRRFKPFVEDILPGLIGQQRALLAHPGDYPACPVGKQEPTVLVVGPEGGFIPYEVAQMERAGCTTIDLGARILRVENAVVALLAKLG